MLEMTAGRVATLPESYLGLRHGPMSYIDKDTLIVCFLSSSPTLRAYEGDLIRELDQKQLGLRKIVVVALVWSAMEAIALTQVTAIRAGRLIDPETFRGPVPPPDRTDAGAVARVHEEVEAGAVVPHVPRPVRREARHVGLDPPDPRRRAGSTHAWSGSAVATAGRRKN